MEVDDSGPTGTRNERMGDGEGGVEGCINGVVETSNTVEEQLSNKMTGESEDKSSEERETESEPSDEVDVGNEEEPNEEEGIHSDSDTESSDIDTASESESDSEFNPRSLSDIIIEEIQNGTYVCLVCTSEIDSDCEIWSCESCFRVYDLECIRDWAIRGSSTKNKKWRCPSCNDEISKIPSKFTCWCGKVENPQSNSLIPFSCGNICNTKYEDCIHSCSSPCHPAQHPICGALGPVMKCQCGNHQRQVPCIITPYKTGWTCEDKCDISICDMGHKCIKNCHSGFCGICHVPVKGSCYCGKNDLEIKCHDKYLKPCDDRVGIGFCEETTKYFFDCNVHFEILDCQPPRISEPCKHSPEVSNTCYCGKSPASGRSKCTDPIPECELVCGKLMDCGCTCEMKCHEGPCECFKIIKTKCSCQNYEYLVPCKALQQEFSPQCEHKCDALLSCRRHYHKAQCCEYEKVALDRERLRKKQIRNKLVSNVNQDIMSIESIHICTKNCNRLKACQKHSCDALCHAGPCQPCLESTNDDLVCNCGKTVIPAPVRCGTKINCVEQCVRSKSCGHKPEIHHCHETGVCPPCTERISRKCECGRNDMPNILCSAPVPKCSYICRELKNCGHECSRACSKACNEGVHLSYCSSVCKKIRKSCPHRCQEKCHFGKKECDDVSCRELIELSCDCGRIVKKVPCGADKTKDSVIDSKLHCDEECESIQRDNELKVLFTGEPTIQESGIVYSTYVVDTYRRQTNWCSMMEGFLRDLIVNKLKKFHHFQPMNHPQRKFIHELAQTFKLYSESLDPEPKRTVYVYITQYTVLPEMPIKQFIEEEDKKRQLEEIAKKLEQEKLNEELFNSIIIEDVFFGITQEKLLSIIEPNLSTYHLEDQMTLKYIQGRFILVFTGEQLTVEIENNLYLLMKFLQNNFRNNSIAFDCKLSLLQGEEILKIDSKVIREPPQKEKLENLDNQFDILQDQTI